VRRELAEGHAIGDHSWSHPRLSAISDGAVRSELVRTLGEIRRATGSGTPLMRPPYGATNRHVAAVTRHMGMAQILWSVDTNDWRDRNSAIVAHRAVSWARPGGIILMHDIHPTTVNAVPKILAGLAHRGFTFVTVPELFGGRALKPGQVYFDGPVPQRKNPHEQSASHPKGQGGAAAPPGAGGPALPPR
jgi:peptidoglycan/xylan/chitin deacetylase (PgdA/CDA1 family)